LGVRGEDGAAGIGPSCFLFCGIMQTRRGSHAAEKGRLILAMHLLTPTVDCVLRLRSSPLFCRPRSAVGGQPCRAGLANGAAKWLRLQLNDAPARGASVSCVNAKNTCGRRGRGYSSSLAHVLRSAEGSLFLVAMVHEKGAI
jgi:hypothetical protein